MCKHYKKIPGVYLTIIKRIENSFGALIKSVLSDPKIKLTDAQRAAFDKRLKAMIYVESNGNPGARGKAGEIGLLQTIPKYAERVAKWYAVDVGTLATPENQIKAGAFMLYDNFKKSNNDLDLATRRYNSASDWNNPDLNQAGEEYLKKVKNVEVNVNVT